jgi:hypothetical protein
MGRRDDVPPRQAAAYERSLNHAVRDSVEFIMHQPVYRDAAAPEQRTILSETLADARAAVNKQYVPLARRSYAGDGLPSDYRERGEIVSAGREAEIRDAQANINRYNRLKESKVVETAPPRGYLEFHPDGDRIERVPNLDRATRRTQRDLLLDRLRARLEGQSW